MRIEGYEFELVTTGGLTLGKCDGILPGGKISGNVDTQIRWSGSIQYRGNISVADWLHLRLRTILTVNGRRFPLGLFVVRPGEEKMSPTGRVIDLDLYDRTFAAANDAVETNFALDNNTLVSDAVATLLKSTGEQNVAIAPHPARLSSPLVWEAGTTKLKIINDILDAAGCFALYTDFHGVFHVDSYVPPARRGVEYEFTPSKLAVHAPLMVRNPQAKVPNKIVCVSQETANQKSMTAIALNEDPDSPFSFQNQGVWITATHTGVEAVSQAVLDQTAQRLLASAASGATVKRSMLARPLPLSSVVVGEWGGREVVENVDITLTPGVLMQVETREVK